MLCRCSWRPRRTSAVFGACSTLFFGALIFNKLLLKSGCASSCSTSVSYAYQRLQKNEASKRVKHPPIKAFEVNYLGSNSPIEDRFAAAFSPALGVGMFSVIDGHKGWRCSSFIQDNLLQYLTSALFKTLGISAPQSHVKMCMTMNKTFETEDHPWNLANIPPSVVDECLSVSFNALEEFISHEALADVKLILQGHSMTPDMKERIMRAIEGACVILAVVQTDRITVATTGDCRVVIGQEQVDRSWKALPLSTDQNAGNEIEVERLEKAHPGENVVINGRVLGSLMPFRTFGDVDFKWDVKYLKDIVPVWPNYLTPPYITAEPVITHHKKAAGDKFMIIASDGLWERISNEDAVNTVANFIKQDSDHSFLRLLSRESGTECCPRNAATQLLWHALGGTEEAVLKLLDISPTYSRMFRDDITVIIVFFE